MKACHFHYLGSHSRFGILYHEKSGNPGQCLKTRYLQIGHATHLRVGTPRTGWPDFLWKIAQNVAQLIFCQNAQFSTGSEIVQIFWLLVFKIAQMSKMCPIWSHCPRTCTFIHETHNVIGWSPALRCVPVPAIYYKNIYCSSENPLIEHHLFLWEETTAVYALKPQATVISCLISWALFNFQIGSANGGVLP
jgi:hypothetical protein